MTHDKEEAEREKIFRELFGPPPITGPWWDKQAAELQRRVMESDAHTAEIAPPLTGAQVKLAILHTRHDMLLLVSSLSSANLQLRKIRRLLAIVASLLAVIAVALLLQ